LYVVHTYLIDPAKLTVTFLK